MTDNRFSSNKIRLKKGEYQRPNGTFEYKWTDDDGQRHSVYAETLLGLRKKEEEVLKDSLDKVKLKTDYTINSYFKIWRRVKSGVRETTINTYLRVYDRYIQSDFGNTKLEDLNYSRLVMFYKDLIENHGIGVSTVDNINVILSMILNVALRDGVIRTNPCIGAMKELKHQYSGTVKKVNALTRAEQTLLEEFLTRPGVYNSLSPLITVMLYTGIRVGELGGLKWSDIDFENNEIHINHTLIYESKTKGGKSEYSLNPPKTRTSERCIPMNIKVREALIEEKNRQKIKGIKCAICVDGYTNFVFLADSGKPFDYKKLNHRLDRISEAIDNEIKRKGSIYGLTSFPHVHSHMLRHTFATRMREAGADMKATSDIMGHHEVDITLNTYTDTSDEFKRKEISLLDSTTTHKKA